MLTYALSPTQHGILVESLRGSAQHMYIEQMSLRLQGPLDARALEKVFDDAVARHEILRTGFRCYEVREPMQVIASHADLPWETQDWRSKPYEKRDEDLDRLMQQERERGFDLEKAPLMRVILVQTTDQQTVLIWTWHHILMDGWSAAQLLGELIGGYQLAL